MSVNKFIQHLPCPRCGSKDNLAEYEDHFFCFGCKYHKLKNDLQSIRQRLSKKSSIESTNEIDLKTSSEIPPKAIQWLNKFGITPNEIKDFGISFNVEQELLVLLKTPSYWQARTFGNQKVKYLSKGSKPLTFYGKSDKLVCVEDILSAIKISRLSPDWCACPLLGSYMSKEFIQGISGKFSTVVIWLDRDKAKEAVKTARMLRERGFNTSVVVSPKDPKEYSKGELSEWLKNKS